MSVSSSIWYILHERIAHAGLQATLTPPLSRSVPRTQYLIPMGSLIISRMDSGSGYNVQYTSLTLSSPPSMWMAPSTCTHALYINHYFHARAGSTRPHSKVLQRALMRRTVAHECSLECFAVKGTSAAGMQVRSAELSRALSGGWSHAEHRKRLTDSKSSATMEFVSPYWSVTIEGPTTRYSFSFSSKALLHLHTSLHIMC